MFLFFSAGVTCFPSSDLTWTVYLQAVQKSSAYNRSAAKDGFKQPVMSALVSPKWKILFPCGVSLFVPVVDENVTLWRAWKYLISLSNISISQMKQPVQVNNSTHKKRVAKSQTYEHEYWYPSTFHLPLACTELTELENALIKSSDLIIYRSFCFFVLYC